MSTCDKFASVFEKYEKEGCKFVSSHDIKPVKKSGLVAWFKSLVNFTR